MSEQKERSAEEFIADLYDVIVRQRAAKLREEDRSLTEQQAQVRAYKEHPEFYDAYLAAQRVKQMKQMKQGH